MRRLIVFILGLLLVFMLSCNSNPLDVDVSDIKVDMKMERFDQDFKACSKDFSYSSIGKLADKYPYFFDVYNENIIACGSYSDLSYIDYIKAFFSDYTVVEAYKAVEKEFASCNDVQNILIDGFKHLLYYYPNYDLPRVVTFVAGFNQSIVIMDGYVGIGLDKYLGSRCPLYDMLRIPDYAKREMQRDRIPYDVMTEMFHDMHPYKSETDNLANRMIYNGICLYFLEAMFPRMPETDRLLYTESELKYCRQNERNIWTSIIENKYLFTTDDFSIKKFTENAPFTSQFGSECPARVANWIGLQIVKSYVENNDVSVVDLLSETDYQGILNKSDYSPK